MRSSLAYTRLEFKAPKKWLNIMCCVWFSFDPLFYLHPALESMCPQIEVQTHTQRYSSVSRKSLEKTLVSVAAVFCVLNSLNRNHCFKPGSWVRSHLCVQVLSTSKNFIWPVVVPSLGILWNSTGNFFSGAVMNFTSVSESHVPWEDSLDDTCCNCKLELTKTN